MRTANLNINKHFEEVCCNLPPNGQFTVYRLEDMLGLPPLYRRRDFYKITLMTGDVKLQYADQGILVDRPAVLFSNPLIPYSFEALSENVKGFACLFTDAFLKNGDRSASLQDSPLFRIGAFPVTFLSDIQYNTLSDLYNRMIAEMETTYVYKFELIRNYVNLVIHETMKMEPVNDTRPHHNASSRIAMLFMELLEKQFPIGAPSQVLQLKTAGDFAGSLAIHVNHLNRAVREVTGKSTSIHITERIITEARSLLKNTDWSVAEIGYSLGFDYPAYFNNFFKKQTGVTPRSVR
ncbi:helix-turn-helix domain-containing protein [Chitinophaga tropicalis]|nr:helix-turn-helix transcriptional regulator [Chitinophaga tropicalis]